MAISRPVVPLPESRHALSNCFETPRSISLLELSICFDRKLEHCSPEDTCVSTMSTFGPLPARVWPRTCVPINDTSAIGHSSIAIKYLLLRLFIDVLLSINRYFGSRPPGSLP